MKKHIGWDYHPYRPLMEETGLYICRVVPDTASFTCFWLPESQPAAPYEVFCKAEGEQEFRAAGTTNACRFTVTGLETDRDYAFFVRCGQKSSPVRLVHTGVSVGTTVNYLHPRDPVYSFSGRFLCSPALVQYPDGYLLASMDLFEGGGPQNLTLLFGSSDGGASWSYVSELFPCFWGKLFLHRGTLYMLSCSTEYGDLLIGASADRGKSFTEPVVLFRGSNGKKRNTGVHKNPQPVVEHRGRIYNTLEWGSWGKGFHAPMVMSASADADLLNPESWTFSEPVRYNENWEGLPKGPSNGNIEGCLTVAPDGELYNIMRYDMHSLTPNYGLAIRYRVDCGHPDAPLRFDRAIPFPANHSKFEIKKDPQTGFYYTICSRITCPEDSGKRTLLSLMKSADTVNWQLVCDLMDYRSADPGGKRIGFQYADFLFSGEDILYLCRTALNGAETFHNSNYITFHRIRNFRAIGKSEKQTT